MSVKVIAVAGVAQAALLIAMIAFGVGLTRERDLIVGRERMAMESLEGCSTLETSALVRQTRDDGLLAKALALAVTEADRVKAQAKLEARMAEIRDSGRR
jgi:hypothetical protein